MARKVADREVKLFEDLLEPGAIDDGPGTELAGARSLPLNLIDPNPYQPRQERSQSKYNRLVASVRKHGVIQPIIVQRVDDRFVLIAGGQRTDAAREVGLTEIPAIIRDEMAGENSQVLSLTENIQRADMTPGDTARAVDRLQTLSGWGVRQIARELGRSPAWVSYSLKLVREFPHLLDQVDAGLLTAAQARQLFNPKDEEPEPEPEGVYSVNGEYVGPSLIKPEPDVTPMRARIVSSGPSPLPAFVDELDTEDDVIETQVQPSQPTHVPTPQIAVAEDELRTEMIDVPAYQRRKHTTPFAMEVIPYAPGEVYIPIRNLLGHVKRIELPRVPKNETTTLLNYLNETVVEMMAVIARIEQGQQHD